jgi:hypothetical protein
MADLVIVQVIHSPYGAINGAFSFKPLHDSRNWAYPRAVRGNPLDHWLS